MNFKGKLIQRRYTESSTVKQFEKIIITVNTFFRQKITMEGSQITSKANMKRIGLTKIHKICFSKNTYRTKKSFHDMNLTGFSLFDSKLVHFYNTVYCW